VGVLTAAVLVGTAAPALAVPAPPPNPTDGQIGAAKSEQDAASAEVGRIAGLVATADAELEKVGIQAEAAGNAYESAQAALEQAQERAAQTAAELQAAADAVGAPRPRVGIPMSLINGFAYLADAVGSIAPVNLPISRQSARLLAYTSPASHAKATRDFLRRTPPTENFITLAAQNYVRRQRAGS